MQSAGKEAIFTVIAALIGLPQAFAGALPINGFARLQGVIVRTTVEDAHGIIWLGTDDGVWRWTGDVFEQVELGLRAGTRIHHITLNHRGQLLLGSDNGLLAIDPLSTEQDPRYRILTDKPVSYIQVGSGDTYWLGAFRGVYHVQCDSVGCTPELIPTTKLNNIFDMLPAPDGGVLAATTGTILHVVADDASELHSALVGNSRVQTLLRTADNALWVGLRTPGGLLRIDGAGALSFDASHGLTNVEVNDLIQSPDGIVWIATEEGVFRYDGQQFHLIHRQNGLTNPDVHSLFVDAEGQTWIGSFGSGVFRLRSPHVETYTHDDGLRHQVITSVRAGPQGRMITGSVSGAASFDPLTGVAQPIGEAEFIKTLYADETGELWLAHYLDCLHPADGRVADFQYATQIIKDRAGDVLFCSSPGPWRWRDGRPEKVTLPEGVGGGCRSVAVDKNNRLYVTTTEGIVRIDSTGGKVLRVDEEVGPVIVSSTGRVLVNVDHGIAELVNELFVPLRDPRSIPFAVREFVEDQTGRIWGATDRGIARIDGADIEWFGYEDGLPTRDVRSVAIGAGGFLYAGTTQGLVRVDKERWQPCDVKPHAMIEELIAGTMRSLGTGGHLHAPYPLREVVARVRTNGWRSRQGIRYRYKLEGRDESWSEPLQSSVWRGSDLPSGKFTLLVRAINERGIEGDVIAASFTIASPPWHNRWFIAGCVALALLVSGGTSIAARRRRHLRRAADAADRAKKEFVARMSHELRTPLTVMLASAEFVARDREGDGQHAEHLRTILRNGHHLLEVVNDVLDLARLGEHKGAGKSKRLSVPILMRELYDLATQRLSGEGVTVCLDLAPGTPMHIEVDATKLRQILINLVDNAAKFTDRGRILLRVEPIHDSHIEEHAQARGALRFLVTDTGTGIPDDRREAIFEAFEQVDSSICRRSGGTGLGLTIAKALADVLGGRITLTSRLGQGSTFALELPVAVSPPIDRNDNGSISPGVGDDGARTRSSVDQHLEGVRVLLADDHEDLRRILSLSLEEVGADVTGVASGGELVTHAISKPYHIALIDIHMPEMDGVATLHQLHERGIDMPALAITADVTIATRRRCLEAGFDGLVAKPFRIDDLIGVMHPMVRPESTRRDNNADEARSATDDNSRDYPVRAGAATDDKLASSRDRYEDDESPIFSELAYSPRLMEVAGFFAHNLLDDIERLREAIRAEDERGLLETAHRLIGAGGISGYACVSHTARALEQAVKDADLNAAGALVEQLTGLQVRMQAGIQCGVRSMP